MAIALLTMPGGTMDAKAEPEPDTVSILLTWDANTDEDLAGYRVRYGLASGRYDESVDVGAVTSVTLKPFTAGTTYYFVVSAYDTRGLEGPPSDEIHFTPTGTPPALAMEALPAPPAGDPALSAARASISGWRVVEDSGFRFVVTATPGQTLCVLASNDLLNWESLGTFDNPSGRFQVIDHSVGTSLTRYYQVLPAEEQTVGTEEETAIIPAR